MPPHSAQTNGQNIRLYFISCIKIACFMKYSLYLMSVYRIFTVSAYTNVFMLRQNFSDIEFIKHNCRDKKQRNNN